MLDKRIPKVGRLRRASGTTDPETFFRIERVIAKLVESEKWNTLRALKDGRLFPLLLVAKGVPLPNFEPPVRHQLWIYAIHRPDTNEVKIGFSRNPEQRLACLQQYHGEPLVMLGKVRGTGQDEDYLHARFASARKPNGAEWFYGTPEILAWASNMEMRLLPRMAA